MDGDHAPGDTRGVDARRPPDSWPRSGRVLVVDDDPAILDVIREMLTETGYEVSTAQEARRG